jgi:hypothetical protein
MCSFEIIDANGIAQPFDGTSKAIQAVSIILRHTIFAPG